MGQVLKKIRKKKEEVPEEDVCEDLENKTTGWFDIPYEIRREIIEMMDTPSKCIFSGFSKQCRKEVGMSKNFIQAVLVNRVSPLLPPRIVVRYGNMRTELHFNETCVKVELFRVTMIEAPRRSMFENSQGGNDIIESRTLPIVRPVKKWEIEVEAGESVQSCMARYFGYIMKHASNSPMTLAIALKPFPYEKTNIQNLRKLKIIENVGERKDLNLVKKGFLNIEQLYPILDRINLRGVCLNFEQLLKLKAECIILDPIGITSKEINQYIKLWRSGQLHANLKHLELEMKGAKLNREKIVEGLEYCSIRGFRDSHDRVVYKLQSLVNPDQEAIIKMNQDSFIMCLCIRNAPQNENNEYFSELNCQYWNGIHFENRVVPVW